MTKEEAKQIVKDTIYKFIDNSENDKVIAMTREDKLLLQLNKSICSTIDSLDEKERKAIEQETVSKEVYDTEHFARKEAEYELWKIKKQQSEDCVSRQMVKEGMIKYGFRAPDMTVTEFIEDELSPVTPTHGTCKDCKKYRNSLEHCTQWVMPTNDDFYCADYEKSEVMRNDA